MDIQVLVGTGCLGEIYSNVAMCSLQFALNGYLELTDPIHREQEEQAVNRAPKVNFPPARPHSGF